MVFRIPMARKHISVATRRSWCSAAEESRVAFEKPMKTGLVPSGTQQGILHVEIYFGERLESRCRGPM